MFTIYFLTSPQETLEGVKAITLERMQTAITSNFFQKIIFANLYYSYLWIFMGAAGLHLLAKNIEENGKRKRRELFPQADLSHLEDYLSDLNARIDLYESPCFM